MNTKEVATAIQFAVGQLTKALVKINDIDVSAIDPARGISISLTTGNAEHEIVIFEDARVVFAPHRKPLLEPIQAQLRGRPGNLPTKTCPTCRGSGTI